jgi:hypothetical protein
LHWTWNGETVQKAEAAVCCSFETILRPRQSALKLDRYSVHTPNDRGVLKELP